jgi:hypothetical protein
MHIYAFGSVCRGEILRSSDIDLLAIVDGYDERFDPQIYSIYSYRRASEIWLEGNPFAWHLYLESRPLFLSNGIDWLKELGRPSPYTKCEVDCTKFQRLFLSSKTALLNNGDSIIFDLSTVFLCMRNIATCYSLGMTDKPNFSRHSALMLGTRSVPISSEGYAIFERARILSTRGKGLDITEVEAKFALREFSVIETWIERLLGEVQRHA